MVAKQQKEYEEKVEKFKKDCMNSLDGSHRKLKRLVKKNLHDPKSFEHIETVFGINNDKVKVVLKYRGKNGFGALVVGSVTAFVSLDNCEVLEIEQN